MTANPHMLKKVRSMAIMESARDEPCAARVSSLYPGHACSHRSTTVGAHLPVFGKGVNTKVTDTAVCFACFNCHDIIDGRDRMRSEFIADRAPTAYMERLLNGLVETHLRMIDMGIIVVPDAEFV